MSLLPSSSREAAGSFELMVHLDYMVISQMTAMFEVTVLVIQMVRWKYTYEGDLASFKLHVMYNFKAA